MEQKTALLIGSTGFIGAQLLQQLLNDQDYKQVIVVVRKHLDLNHPKLKILIGNFDTIATLKPELVADEIFISIGTTKKHTPDQKMYYQIDHDYPVLAARIAKENGAKSVFLVSAVGANANSGVFYIKTKGETERDIIALGFEHTHLFRPSMIMGNRPENRPLEKTLIKVWSFINPLLIGGWLKPYRGIDAGDIATAMRLSAKKQSEPVKYYQWQEMHDLVKNKDL